MSTLIIGHRGIRGLSPENTIASFREAIRQGSDGIESDVRLTSDNVISLLHDNDLSLMTTGTGLVSETPWYGGIEHLRTKQRPHLPIPIFADVIDLLMEPAHRHLKFSIDCKEHSDPELLFLLMHQYISSQENYLETLAPRLILGVWHTAFIEPAKRLLPYCQLHHLSCSTEIARSHFFDLAGFNLSYAILKTKKGQAFMRDAMAAGKEILVWNLTETHEYFLDVLEWGLYGITTDNPSTFYQMRALYNHDRDALRRPLSFWKRTRRSWFLKRSAKLDIAWHSTMLKEVKHPSRPSLSSFGTADVLPRTSNVASVESSETSSATSSTAAIEKRHSAEARVLAVESGESSRSASCESLPALTGHGAPVSSIHFFQEAPPPRPFAHWLDYED